jgi:hypothetical protein
MLKHRFFLSDLYFHYYPPTEFENFHKVQYGYSSELTQRSAFHEAHYAALDFDSETGEFSFKAIPARLTNLESEILENIKRVSQLTD